MTKAFNYLKSEDTGCQEIALAADVLGKYSDRIPYRIASEGEIKRAVRGEPTSLLGFALDVLGWLFSPTRKKYLGACTQDGEILLSNEAGKKDKKHEDVHWLLQNGIMRKPDYIPEEKFADRVVDEFYASKLPGGLKGFV